MTLKRFILLKPKDAGEVDGEDLSGITSLAHVVDSIGVRALLVEVQDEHIEALRNQLMTWTVDEERTYELPDGNA